MKYYYSIIFAAFLGLIALSLAEFDEAFEEDDGYVRAKREPDHARGWPGSGWPGKPGWGWPGKPGGGWASSGWPPGSGWSGEDGGWGPGWGWGSGHGWGSKSKPGHYYGKRR